MTKLKPVKELNTCRVNIDSNNIYVSSIGGINQQRFDTNVFLESKGFNLQRPYVWTIEQQRELIHSVLIGREIPKISFMIEYHDDKSEKITVIDGKQRLLTFKRFVNNEFTISLEGNEYYLKDLPEDYQNKVNRYIITGIRAEPRFTKPYTDQDKIDWFTYINFAGTVQDISHFDKLKS